jgi:hypothetical protein
VRRVVTNAEVSHLWAHQAQDEARNGKGSFYFQGATIYSYGSHFPIASHATGVNGQTGILFTTEKNSVTTMHHISLVRRAIPPDVPVFNVLYQHFGFTQEEDKYQHSRNLVQYASNATELISKCARARSVSNKEWYHRDAVELRKEALCYATFFGLEDPPINQVPELDSEEMEKLRQREAKAAAKKAEASRKEAEERRQKALSLADEWRQGGPAHYLLNAIPAMLRIKGHEVETSRGARFPIIHAKRGLALVRAVKARGEEWVRNGPNCRLGHYHLDRISPEGDVTAGCHQVPWEEIERIADDIEEYEPRIKCRQCQMLSINGAPCHETGCPNSNKIWSIEENDWIEAEREITSETE